MLAEDGHKVILEKTEERNVVELEVNEEIVFQCNITDLEFGKPPRCGGESFLASPWLPPGAPPPPPGSNGPGVVLGFFTLGCFPSSACTLEAPTGPYCGPRGRSETTHGRALGNATSSFTLT